MHNHIDNMMRLAHSGDVYQRYNEAHSQIMAEREEKAQAEGLGKQISSEIEKALSEVFKAFGFTRR